MSHKYHYFVFFLTMLFQFEVFASDIEAAVLNAIEKESCLIFSSHNNDICIKPVNREEVDSSTSLSGVVVLKNKDSGMNLVLEYRMLINRKDRVLVSARLNSGRWGRFTGTPGNISRNGSWEHDRYLLRIIEDIFSILSRKK